MAAIVWLVLLICFHDGLGDNSGDIRLPKSIVPENYRIKLLPMVQEGDFRLFGSVRMDFLVKEATDRIVMHAVNLTVSNDINVVPLTRMAGRCAGTGKSSLDDDPLELQSDSQDQVSTYQVTYDTDKEFVIIQLPWTLRENNRYRIDLNYRGFISETLDGLYRSYYIDRSTNTKRWLAVTQMEPTDARKAFPCLDEPAFKATFEIIIGRHENMSSVSNMPLVRSLSMRNKDGWYWDHFEKSVPMSTYLVACLISDFVVREATPATRQLSSSDPNQSTSIRVWVQRDKVDQTDVALRVTTPMLEFLEEYFQVEYPLPKLDLVAVPDFSAGAMENWGLITFRETTLLVEPTGGSSRNQMSVERVIAHELAHQWFGNLVTMQWWNDLWLNEGFATYVERLVMDNVSPKYQYGILQDLDFQRILHVDALESSHPISVVVKYPSEIGEIFDGVSYTKGCAVIRMMNHFLGESTFRRALTNYLQQMKYRNAEQDDLWRFMTIQAHADDVLPAQMDVKSIMDTWTLQMGFPVVTITRNYTSGWAEFKQNRFLRIASDQSSKKTQPTKGEPLYIWWVPVSYTDAAKKDFGDNNTRPRLWLSPEQPTVWQDVGADADSWIIGNIQSTGFYRINYDQNNWKMLSDQLSTDHKSIDVVNRARLISDSFALASAGHLSYTTPLNLVRYMRNEGHFVPWQSAMGSLGYIGTMLQFTPHFGRYEAFMAYLVRPAYQRVGSVVRAGEDLMTSLTRETLSKKACSTGYRPCIQQSQDLFEEWMNAANPLNFTGIQADSRANVYCVAIKHGGSREWNFAWAMAQNVTSGHQRAALLSALGCSTEPWILLRYLSMTLDPSSGIRKQDGRSVIGSVAANVVGRSLAFQFIRDNLDQLVQTFTAQRTMEALSSTVSSFNKRDELLQVEELLSSKSAVLDKLQTTSKKIVTTIRANVDWMERNSRTLVEWFRSQGF